MRCPACNARNPDGAEWCSQCFTDLRAPTPQPTPPPSSEEPGSPASVPAADAPLAVPSRGAAESSDRFRRTDEGIDWRCATCDTWSPLEVTSCTVCGAAFARTLRADEPEGPQPAELSEGVALAASVALPGLAHILAKRTATGVLRALFFVSWLVGGVLLAREAAGSGQAITASLPLFLGALIIWVGSVLDAQAITRTGEDVVLVPRVFMWVVVGVVGLLMVTFLATSLSVGGSETTVDVPG